MDENQVQELINSSLNNGQYGYGKTPYHIHNGTDSPSISVKDITGLPSNASNGDTLYFLNGQWVSLAIGSAGTVLQSTGSAPTFAFQSSLKATFVSNTRQSIATGNAVVIGNGTNDFPGLVSQTADHSTGAAIDGSSSGWFGQSFISDPDVTAINGVTMWFQRGNFAGTSTANISIRATTFSGGNFIPTGADLGYGTTAAFGGGVPFNAPLAVNFISPITVTPNTWYAIIVRNSIPDANVPSVNYKNSAGGLGLIYYNSTDSGATWGTDSNKVFYFSLTENIRDTGLLGLATATGSSPTYYNNFVGFSTQSKSTNSTVVVDIDGIDNNQSSLTIGSTYFLSNTPGAISTSAGTNSRKVGLSVSTTGILIKYDNP